MKRVLHVFQDDACDGPTNMGRDEALLYAAAAAPAALRVYGWTPPTLSLGYFQAFAETERLPEDLRRLAVVRRPTGGGAILHDREVTYCLVADETIAAARQAPAVLYRLVHECWRDALAAGGRQSALAPDSMPLPSPRSGPFFCFEKPGKTDLLLGDLKVLGSAQRRIPGRVLQHGSLILGRRYAAHPGADLGDPQAAHVRDWIDRFVAVLGERLDLSPETGEWSADLLADAETRRTRYASEEWNRLR